MSFAAHSLPPAPVYRVPQDRRAIGVFVFRGMNKNISNGAVPERFTQDPRVEVLQTSILNTGETPIMHIEGHPRSPSTFRSEILARARTKDFRLAICISGGGFPGLNLGIEGDFDVIVGLSAYTVLRREFFEFAPKLRSLVPIIRSESQSLAEMDLGRRLKREGFGGQIHLAYPEENRLDRVQAMYLRRFPQVTLHPFPGRSHRVWTRFGGIWGLAEHIVDFGFTKPSG